MYNYNIITVYSYIKIDMMRVRPPKAKTTPQVQCTVTLLKTVVYEFSHAFVRQNIFPLIVSLYNYLILSATGQCASLSHSLFTRPYSGFVCELFSRSRSGTGWATCHWNRDSECPDRHQPRFRWLTVAFSDWTATGCGSLVLSTTRLSWV